MEGKEKIISNLSEIRAHLETSIDTQKTPKEMESLRAMAADSYIKVMNNC